MIQIVHKVHLFHLTILSELAIHYENTYLQLGDVLIFRRVTDSLGESLRIYEVLLRARWMSQAKVN